MHRRHAPPTTFRCDLRGGYPSRVPLVRGGDLDRVDHRARLGGRDTRRDAGTARGELRAYVQDELVQLLAEPYFDYAADSATAGYGSLGAERAGLLRDRLKDIAAR